MTEAEKKLDEYFLVAKKLADELTDHPEIGLENPFSAGRAIDILLKEGYRIERPFGGLDHAFRASLVHEKPVSNYRLALLMEYDALPDLGHACGHSISGAISLLSFLTYMHNRDDVNLSVDLIGCPGEEFPGGKILLAERGVFADYDLACMVHLGSANYASTTALAIVDRLISFQGKSAHASTNPQEGRNALNAGRLFMTAMDMWRQHLPTTDQFHGVVVEGGELPSVVPEKTVLNYYLRSKNVEDLRCLSDKLTWSAEGAALATDTQMEINQQYPMYPDLSYNATWAKLIRQEMEELGMEVEGDYCNFGSTDLGAVDQLIPSIQPMIDATGDRNILLHSTDFARAMKNEPAYMALKQGGMLLVQMLEKLNRFPDIIEEIVKEHRKKRNRM